MVYRLIHILICQNLNILDFNIQFWRFTLGEDCFQSTQNELWEAFKILVYSVKAIIYTYTVELAFFELALAVYGHFFIVRVCFYLLSTANLPNTIPGHISGNFWPQGGHHIFSLCHCLDSSVTGTC